MDEVLAVWAARLPTPGAIISALYHGAEFSPPTYHLFLHYLSSVLGSSYLVLRLPSVISALISGLCVFALLRRYLPLAACAFSFPFALIGVLAGFGLEIRPYSLVVACFAVALLFWDDLERSRFPTTGVCAIALLLAAAIALHFYAVLLIPCMALMELAWSALRHRVRISVWLAFLAAGASLAPWLPLMKALGKYNTGDAFGSDYYARPTLGHLSAAYTNYFIFGKKQTLFLLACVVLCALAAAFEYVRPQIRVTSQELNEEGRRLDNLYIIGFATTAFAVIVYVFAKAVTHTFNARYCLAMALGFAILTTLAIRRTPALRLAVIPLLWVSCALAFVGSSQNGFDPPSSVTATYENPLDLLPQAKQPWPIVIGEGLVYLELEEAAPANLRSRLVYVTQPRGTVSADPTNENQVLRYAKIRSDLKVVDADIFFRRNSRFYILHTNYSTDVLTNWLISKGLVHSVIAHVEDAWLFEAAAPS
jgi:hypothetical protein